MIADEFWSCKTLAAIVSCSYVSIHISHGCGPNPLQNGSPNRFNSTFGYGVGSSGYDISSISRNTLGNGQGGGMASALSSGGSLNFDSADSSLELGPIGFARNTSSNIAPTSSMYASPKLDSFGLFNNQLNNVIFDVTPRDVVHYAQGYNVYNRSTKGICPFFLHSSFPFPCNFRNFNVQRSKGTCPFFLSIPSLF
nr:PREDICTED: uncharacterized protein LOC108199711 isoform X1 [Daucus carota subsp. sativus]